MFIAVILICNGLAGEACTPDETIYSKTVPGRFMDQDDCHQGAITFLHNLDLNGILEPEHDYRVTVTCTGQ